MDSIDIAKVTSGSNPLIKALQSQMTPFLTFFLTIAIINIVLYLVILNWAVVVKKDPDCGCAKDWKLDYALWYPPIAVVLSLILSIVVAKAKGSALLNSAVSVALFAGWFALVVNVYKYVNNLYIKKCTCATSGMIGDEALQIYASLRVAAWAIMMLVAIASSYIAYKAIRAARQ